MKVLTVNHTLDPAAGGGTAERTVQLTRFLAARGAECSTLTLDLGLSADRLAQLEHATVVPLHCINRRLYLFRLPEPRIDERVRWADVVHLMGHWTVLNALVYRSARRHGKPYVICPGGALPVFGRSGWMKRAYNAAVGRRLVLESDACVAIAPQEVEHFAAYGVAPERVTWIPNGVDFSALRARDDAAFRAEFSIPPEDEIVLFVGRLNSIKGPDLLLDAFAELAGASPRARLVYAGPDDGMRSTLETRTADLGLSARVRFIGPIRGVTKSQAYHAAMLLAIPSRQEAMSLVVLEAGACGTPVLLTDQCGFNEVASCGGGVVVPATTAGLAEGLRSMLARPERLPVMGANLRRLVERRYLWERIADDYMRLFESVLEMRAGS